MLYSDIGSDQYIQVRFLEFDVTEDWDFLSIGYGDTIDVALRINQFTGLQAPSYVIIRQGVGWISFDSHPLDTLDLKIKRFVLKVSLTQPNGK